MASRAEATSSAHGQHLRLLRRTVSQKALAALVGANVSSVRRWERGVRPNGIHASALVDVLKISDPALLAWLRSPSGPDDRPELIAIKGGAGDGRDRDLERSFVSALIGGLDDGRLSEDRFVEVARQVAHYLNWPWPAQDSD